MKAIKDNESVENCFNTYKTSSLCTVLIFGLLILLSGGPRCLASESVQKTPPKSTEPIKTRFKAGVRLSSGEMDQVLALASKCGINAVKEIATFYERPTQGIIVRSVDRIDGRNTSYDTVIFHRNDWLKRTPTKDVIRVGRFWVETERKQPHTTLLRHYEYNKSSTQIRIGKGVDISFADQVISLIASKMVRFENDTVRKKVEMVIGDSVPFSISLRNYGENGYRLIFKTPDRAMYFRSEDGQVLITWAGPLIYLY